MAACVWCSFPETGYEPVSPESELCRSHFAEYEGLSVADLDRAEESADADLPPSGGPYYAGDGVFADNH